MTDRRNSSKKKSNKMSPFLKWVGGKTKYIDEIVPKFPSDYERYYEPFIGGGAIFLYLKPEKATISDINIELVNCYQVIKEDVVYLMKNIDLLVEQSDKEDKKEFYLKCRKRYNELKKNYKNSYSDVIDSERETSERETRPEFSKENYIEKASLFIYLNKTGFRGLYRENKKGEMNVPYGNYQNPTIYDKDNLLEISNYLSTKDIQIIHQSYKNIQPSENDFVYFDPPYDQEKSTDFVSYTQDTMNQKDLYEFCRGLGCPFVLSNAPTTNIKNLYKDYKQKILSGTRNVDIKKVRTNKEIEIIIWPDEQ
jgi:DNA adenine methylase